MESTETKAIRHFTDLRVWQKAHGLFVSIHKETGKLSQEAASTIVVDQLLRSAGGISANIAEGFNARKRKKYIEFLENAQSSAAETESWLYKVVDCVLLEKSDVQNWLDTSVVIQKMLGSMVRKLEKKPAAVTQPIASSPPLPDSYLRFRNRRMPHD
jgi:four helix bundle protein